MCRRSTAHDPAVGHEHMARVHAAHRNRRHGKGVRDCRTQLLTQKTFFLLCREVWLFRAGECQRQRVLTVGIEAWGSVLDALQRLIDLEHVGDVLCTLSPQIIERDAANESQIRVLGGADSRKRGVGDLPDALQRLVDLQRL